MNASRLSYKTTISRSEIDSWSPNLNFTDQKDVNNGHVANTRVFLKGLLEHIYNTGTNQKTDDLLNFIMTSSFKINSYNQTYTVKSRSKFSPKCSYNTITSQQYEAKFAYIAKGSHNVISSQCNDSATQILDLVLSFGNDDNKMSVDQKNKMYMAFRNILINYVPSDKNTKSSKSQSPVETRVHDVNKKVASTVQAPMTGLVSTPVDLKKINEPSLISAQVGLTPAVIQKPTGSKWDVSQVSSRSPDKNTNSAELITDELLIKILHYLKIDSALELLDSNDAIYFIPETSVDKILRESDAIFGLDKKFVAEKTIKDNLDAALQGKNGFFKTVLRLNNTKYTEGVQSGKYEQGLQDQITLLQAQDDPSYKVNQNEILFMTHDADNINTARDIVDDSSDDSRAIYNQLNKGLTRDDPVIRKGFLFKMPPDFDDSQFEKIIIKETNYKDLVEKMRGLKSQIEALSSEKNQYESEIAELTNRIIQLEQELEQADQGSQNHIKAVQELIVSFNESQTQLPDSSTITSVLKILEGDKIRIDILIARARVLDKKIESEKLATDELISTIKSTKNSLEMAQKNSKGIEPRLQKIEKEMLLLQSERDRRLAILEQERNALLDI